MHSCTRNLVGWCWAHTLPLGIIRQEIKKNTLILPLPPPSETEKLKLLTFFYKTKTNIYNHFLPFTPPPSPHLSIIYNNSKKFTPSRLEYVNPLLPIVDFMATRWVPPLTAAAGFKGFQGLPRGQRFTHTNWIRELKSAALNRQSIISFTINARCLT